MLKELDMAPLITDPDSNLLYNLLVTLPPIRMGAANSFVGTGSPIRTLALDFTMGDSKRLAALVTQLIELGWHVVYLRSRTSSPSYGLRNDDVYLLYSFHASFPDGPPLCPDHNQALSFVMTGTFPMDNPEDPD